MNNDANLKNYLRPIAILVTFGIMVSTIFIVWVNFDSAAVRVYARSGPRSLTAHVSQPSKKSAAYPRIQPTLADIRVLR